MASDWPPKLRLISAIDSGFHNFRIRKRHCKRSGGVKFHLRGVFPFTMSELCAFSSRCTPCTPMSIPPSLSSDHEGETA